MGRGSQENPAFIPVQFPGTLFPYFVLAGLFPAPAYEHFMLKTLFQLLSLPHVPSLQPGTSGPLPDTLILQLVQGPRRDCRAWLNLESPRVLPPATVTAAASSALPHAPCCPLNSSFSSFSRPSSLGCGQSRRVSESPGSPQPRSHLSCQGTPQLLLRGSMARPLCRVGGG